MTQIIPGGALKVEQRLVSAISWYADNPRQHPEKQLEMLEKSICKYGFNNPVLIDEQGELIAGHGRLIAARRIGLTHVPAIVLAHLSEAERAAYRIADNQIGLKGEWSADLLRSQIEFVSMSDPDFEPFSLGFETPEIDIILSQAEGGDDIDECPAPEPDRTTNPVSRLGDIWTIGSHRLICGDARDPAVYSALFGGQLAGAVISDMPYNVPVNGHVGGSGKIKHREFHEASGEMSKDEFAAFMRDVLTLQAAHARPGANIYQFIDFRSIASMIEEGEKAIGPLLNLCVWVKPSGGMGSFLRSRHELIPIFRKPGGKPINNVELGKHGRYRTNVWEYAAPNAFGSERANLELHPTCKNAHMIADAVLDCTNRGDIILDAFLGSGTTMLAAERTGRCCYGIEIDAHYVDLTLRRLTEASDLQAVRGDGRSFETVHAERIAEEASS